MVEIPSLPGDALTGKIICCILHVHTTLGPGFLEGVYRRALVIELEKQYSLPRSSVRSRFLTRDEKSAPTDWTFSWKVRSFSS